MRDIRIYCDHCGEEIIVMRDHLDVGIIEMAHKRKEVDLCADCFEELRDIVCGFFKMKSW